VSRAKKGGLEHLLTSLARILRSECELRCQDRRNTPELTTRDNSYHVFNTVYNYTSDAYPGTNPLGAPNVAPSFAELTNFSQNTPRAPLQDRDSVRAVSPWLHIGEIG
jgi:hypothetical protein